MLTHRAQTRADAFSQAHRLLDEAEEKGWFRGEVVSISIAQSEE